MQRTSTPPSQGRALAIALLLLGGLLCSCSGDRTKDESVSSQALALTLSQPDVLGFEAVTAWNVNQGTKALSSVRIQGASSLTVSGGGFTEIESVPLSSLGRAPESFYVDVRLPEVQVNPYWYGAVQMYVTLPSKNINNHFIGQHELTGKPLAKFFTLAFAVPEAVKTALGGTYSDLKLKLTLNVPASSHPYWFDNLRLDDAGQAPPVDGVATCHPFIRVGQNGDVRYQLETTVRPTQVDLFVRKNGVSLVTRTFTTPSQSDPNGTFLFTSDHPAADYSAGDELLVRYTTVEGGTTRYTPGPTANDWSLGFRYDPGYSCRPAPTSDACPNDPLKTVTGLCGCNEPETNSDGDALPNCLDRCPLDPARLAPGDCGCAGSFLPAGTPCDDAPAPGVFTCDGAGVCGDIEAARPPGTTGPLSSILVGDTVYVVVRADPKTFANAVQAAPEGYRLVRVTSEVESVLIGKIVATLGTNATVWTDAKVSEPGKISYTTRSGAPEVVLWDGTPVDGAHTKWAPGQPPPNVTSGCVVIDAAGMWRVESCSTPRLIVYERPTATLTFAGAAPSVTCADFPGIVCEPNREPVEEPCVHRDEVFTDAERQALGVCQTCLDNCQDCNDQLGSCADECTGVSSPPPGSSRCPAVNFGASCAVSNPGAACETNADCCTGPNCSVVCGVFANCATCNDPDGDGHCGVEPCPAELRCGTPVEGCESEPFDPNEVCEETVLCPASNALGNPDPFGVGLEELTTPAPFVPKQIFGEPAPAEVGQFPPVETQFPPEPAAHPWCNLTIDNPLEPKTVADTKSGQAGQGRAVQFDIDPNITLDYSVDPLPSGQINYEVTAQASLSASVSFNFANISGSVSILDAMLSARADRCGYSTLESRLELFDHNFLPDLAPGFLMESTGRPACEASLAGFQEVGDRAKKAMRDAQELLKQYHDALERGECFSAGEFCRTLLTKVPSDFPVLDCATAAVEDVVNLFIFYYELQIDGQAKPPNLPDLKLPTLSLPSGGPRFSDIRLPNSIPRLPDIDLPSAVNFREFGSLRKLPDLKSGGKALNLKGIRGEPGVTFPPAALGCTGANTSTEQRTLFETTFPLGPIPMVVEVTSVLKYGLGGDIDFALTPETLADLALSGADATAEVAKVTANASPCVSAGLGLYIGAGFSFAGFRATAGVEGIVNLATLQMPSFATASISVHAKDVPLANEAAPTRSCAANDTACELSKTAREVSDDLKGLWDGTLIPQRRFTVKMGYQYGVGLTANEILAGHLKAALKIKFLWYKKQWRKTLVDFGEGIDLGYQRLIGDESNVAWSGSVPWGSLEMPDPFVKLRYLRRLSSKLTGLDAGGLLDAGLNVPSLRVPDLANIDLGLGDLGDIPVLRGSLPDIGRRLGFKDIFTALSASGANLDALTLADFGDLDLDLGDFSNVPLEVEHLLALNLGVPQLADLGVNLSGLTPDLPGLLDLSALSLADLSRVGLNLGQLDAVQIDWRYLPELGWYLNRPKLELDLEAAGADLNEIRLSDFARLGFDISSFRPWPLTANDVLGLNLNLEDLLTLGVDLSGPGLDLEDMIAQGLDISGLHISDLARLGFDLDDLGAIDVPRAELSQLSTLIGFPDIQLELQRLGKDLNTITLADFESFGASLKDFPEYALTEAHIRAMDLSQSQLVRLGFDLSSVNTGALPEVECGRVLSTARVGRFFYDRQCTCRPEFDAAKPYSQGEQSCFNDGDCCSEAPYCIPSTTTNYNVCSRCAAGDTSCGGGGGPYECSIDVSTGVTNCTGAVQRLEYAPASGSDAATALMKLDFGTFKDFSMTATICQHAGWVLNIGDSPTNNGAGGDSNSFSNDAEITILDRSLSFWADDTHPSPRLLLEQPGFLWDPANCGGATFYITRAPTTTFVAADATVVIHDFSTPHMFRMGAPDTEGQPNTDFWIGLNRTIGDPSRRGSGVRDATFRFSGSVAP